VGSVLIPFLAVYASWGYLARDKADYYYRVWLDDPLAKPRVPTFGVVLLSVVVVSVVLRMALKLWAGVERRPWLGFVSAYVEIIWMTIIVLAVTADGNPVVSWVEQRRLVHWGQDTWHGVVDALGPLSGPAEVIGNVTVGLIGSLDAVILVPIAWLAVGAVVYGHTIAPEPASASDLYHRGARRYAYVPKPVRAVGAGLGADLSDRFGPLVYGLRLIARAGLVPMLLFCLTFLLTQTASRWLWEIERLAIGPQDLESVWMPVSQALSVVNGAISTVLLVCLLGAAIDRVLRVQVPAPQEQPQPAAVSLA
jgi:hypothetical protein